MDRSSTNPALGDQPFKLGLFCYAHRGGSKLTTSPNRWLATWDEIATMARMADRGGLDFLLPVSTWKGYMGEVDHRRWSFEALMQAAALSGITRRISLFSTVNTSLVHPVFAAKALTTIDHASNGRAGVNIVCGWNQADFDMFGAEVLPADKRYIQGMEWFQVLSRLLEDGGEEFDHEGEFFHLKGVVGQPPSVQQPRPAIISAAMSDSGRDFAIRTSDILLVGIMTLGTVADDVAKVRAREAGSARQKPLDVIALLPVTCAETREEAEAYDRHFSVDHADGAAFQSYDARMKDGGRPRDMTAEERARIRRSAGGGLVVGTPHDVVDALLKLKEAGLSGVALQLHHFVRDLPIFTEKVIPLMEEAGLRNPVAPLD